MKKLDEIAGVPGPSFTSGDEKAMNDLMEGTVPGAKEACGPSVANKSNEKALLIEESERLCARAAEVIVRIDQLLALLASPPPSSVRQPG